MGNENLGNTEENAENKAAGGDAGAAGEAGAGTQGAEDNGKPDAAKAAEKYKSQRDEARKRAEALEEQIKNYESKGDIDKVP